MSISIELGDTFQVRAGATVFQDHRAWTWPNLRNVHDAGMVFACCRKSADGWCTLEAPRFGLKENYGNGRIAVQVNALIKCEPPAQEPPAYTKSIERQIFEFSTERWGIKTLEGLGLKVAEEAGEVAGALSKIPERRATLEDLDDEVGDLLIVLSQVAAKRGTTLEALRQRRWEIIKERPLPA